MEKLYRGSVYLMLLVVVGVFSSGNAHAHSGVTIVDNAFNGCLQRTTIEAVGVGPVVFQYWREGVLEGEEIVENAGTNGTFISQVFNLPSGSYTVIAKDANGDTDQIPLNVFLASTVRVRVVSAIDAICAGDPSGEALLEVSSNSNFMVRLYDKANPSVVVRQFSNTENLVGLPAGDYLVEVRDAVNCVAFEEIFIAEPEPIQLAQGEELEVTNPVCEDDLGLVATQILGGNGPEYLYQVWKDGQLYRNNLWTVNAGMVHVDGLEVGQYHIRVFTDRDRDEECFQDYPFEIVYTPKFTIQPTTADVTCFGLANGMASLLLGGDLSPPFSVEYLLEGGASFSLFHTTTDPVILENLAPGPYAVQVRDSEGCLVRSGFSIEEPRALEIVSAEVTEVCYGDDNGQISVTVTGGTAPYRFSLSPEFEGNIAQTGGTFTFEGLSPAAYRVYVTDANDCVVQSEAIVVRAPEMAIGYEILTLEDPECSEAATGKIEIQPTGGWGGPWEFEWTRVGSTNVLSNSGTLEGVPAGQYQVMIIDQNGCSETFNFTLDDPERPVIDTLTEHLSCFGGEDGKIFVTLPGAAESYWISLQGEGIFGTEATFEGLSAGEYTLSIKLGEECYLYRNIRVEEPEELIIHANNVYISPLLCYDDRNGSIAGLVISGGNASFLYQWEILAEDDWAPIPGANSADIEGLGTGVYRLLVTDENGCTARSQEFEFLLPLPLEILDYRANDATCYGGIGSVEIDLDGGTAPYYYSLSGGSYSLLNQNLIPSLSPGSYLIHIRDENGCTLPSPIEVEIHQPAEIVLEEIKTIIPSCEGGNDGGLIATVSGGASGDLQFEWFREGTPAQVLGTDAQIGNLEDGRYMLSVFDSENPACVQTFGPFEVKSPPAIIAEVEKTDLSCQGDASGQLQIKNISGGRLDEGAQYQVAWTGLDFSSSELHIKELVAGEYHLTISDGRGCVFESSYTVNQPENTIAIEVLEVVAPTCFEGSNGRIEISAGNGTMPYSYTWHRQDADSGEFVLLGGQTDSFLHQSVTEGTYQVTVTDKGGCTAVKEIVVAQPEPLRVTLVDKGDVTCFDRNDGFITVDITGGTGAYTFSWSNGQTNQNLTDLRAGDYSLQVFDQNGCRVTSEIFTIAPVVRPQIQLLEKLDVVCEADGGALTIGLGQGVEAEDYDIYWLDLRSGESFGQQQLAVEGLAVGFYQVFVEAGEGCVVDRVFRVEGPEAPLRLLASQLDPGCPGQEGVIYLNATGGFPGYSYFYQTPNHQDWQPLNGTVLNSLAPGDYKVMVRDSKGCADETILSITQPNTPSFSAEKMQGVSCHGGNDGVIAFDVTGGSHQWFKRMEGQDPAPIADGELERLEAGTYFMEVTFAEGCKEKTEDIFIRQPEELVATVEISQPTCVETVGNAVLEIQGGSGSSIVSLYQEGNSISVLEEVYVGTFLFSDLEAGNYEIHISNEGCGVQVHPFVIAAAAEPLEVEVLAEDVSCRGSQDGKISVSVPNTDGISIKLNGQLQPAGQVDFVGLSEGLYTVEVLNGACSVVKQVEISYPDPIVLTTQEVKGVSCQGLRDGFIKVAVNGDFPIRWYYHTGVGQDMQPMPEFDGSTEANNLRPGTYIIEAGGESCKRTLSVPVREPQLLTFTETIVDGSCSGDGMGAIFLQVEGGTAPYRFTWSSEDPAHWVNQATTRDVRNLSPGNYTVLIEDRNGCATGSTFTVSEPNPLIIQSSFTEMLSCHGAEDGYIDNHISGGVQDYQIEWSDNPNIKTPNRTGLAAGTYTLRVTDQNRCVVEKTFDIKEPAPLMAQLFTRVDIDCDTRQVIGNAWVTVEGGTGEYEIRWNSGQANVREVYFNEPGDISVFVKDVNGCTIDVSRTVDFPPLFADADFTFSVISIDEPGEILVNDPLQFRDHTSGNVIAWQWEFGDGTTSMEQNPRHTYSAPGQYKIQLTVYDTYGCSTMSTLAVEVTDSYRILFPNAFTPNGDGLNDTFIPKFRGIDDFEMHIFNTWGELLYSTHSREDAGWNGYHQGRPSPNGNYVYKVNFSTREGKRISRTGVFLLIK